MKYKNMLIVLLISLIVTAINFYPFYNTPPANRLENETQVYIYKDYAQALGLAVTDVNKALNLCSKTNEMKDECFTNIARIIGEKDYEKGLEICEGLTDPKWEGECFFIIAELVFNKNIPLSAEICEKSKMFKEECYSHLVSIPGFIDSKIPSLEGGGGMEAISASCKELPVECRSGCFGGLGESLIWRFEGYFSSAVLSCNRAPVEFKRDCFKGLARGVNWRFSNDINSSISACSEFPIEFRNDCLKSLNEAGKKQK